MWCNLLDKVCCSYKSIVGKKLHAVLYSGKHDTIFFPEGYRQIQGTGEENLKSKNGRKHSKAQNTDYNNNKGLYRGKDWRGFHKKVLPNNSPEDIWSQ